MFAASRCKLSELRLMVGLMPLNVCCTTLLPELGLHWRDVSRAIRNNRLPMTPSSVGHIVTKYVALNMTEDELSDIISRLKLKSIITKPRKWNVIKLLEKTHEEPINVLTRILPSRIIQALKNAKTNSSRRPEVHTIKFGDLIYISIQMINNGKQGSVLYVATPPGEAVALVSSLNSSLLKPCVVGLGYEKFEDSCLHGRDIPSLLRIYNEQDNTLLNDLPEYNVVPMAVRAGIDYTGRETNEMYARELLGPDPPKLDKFTIVANKKFYNPEILNKKIKVKMQINSEDVAKSLQSWAVQGALAFPDLYQMCHKVKSNIVQIDDDDDD